MIRRAFFIGLSFIFLASSLKGQESIKLDKDKIHEIIICNYHERDENVFIPYQNHKARNSAKQNSTIEVEYIGFSSQAEAAFQYAVDIWEDLIISDVPIKIQANWVSLDDGVLGSAGPTTVFRNFNGAQHVNAWYPIALAEKISGQELNDANEFEIVAQFNKDVNWYFGTNAQPPSGNFDLVSVVLHEIGHGLGFFTTADVENNEGSIGLGDFPFEFDFYMENGDGELLIDSEIFDNPSSDLATQLTGGDLFFVSNLIRNVNGNNNAELYAPSNFDGGSSISHLDEGRYANTLNSLMTPSIGSAEANHNIGPITTRLFAQLGWLSSRIDHEPIVDSENVDLPVDFEIAVVSDSSIVADSVFINIDINEEGFNRILMTDNSNNNFTYKTDTIRDGTSVRYYFEVEDVVEKKTFLRSEDVPFSFYIGIDTIKPTLIHNEIVSIVANEDVEFEVNASDNLGLDSVFIDLILKEGDTLRISMDNNAINQYSYLLVSDSLQDITAFQYRIGARDSSTQLNFAYLPSESEYFNVSVNSIASAEEVFIEDFDSEITVISGDFSIELESGFDSKALHSDHPYANGSDENFESDFITTLLKPIVIREGDGEIQFDEVVLVEPGTAGSTFGSEEFFDYVIVEGSKDEGITWSPIEDGYDSRRFSVWENKFNSSTDADNNGSSLALGDATLYKKHKMNLLDRFDAGDTVLLRFRLHTDQLLNGWGWAIDNLIVQDLPLGFEETETISIKSYPNPFTSSIYLSSDKNIREIQLLAMDGRLLNKLAFDIDGAKDVKVELLSIESGTYLMKIVTTEGTVFRRVVKK
ncbi:T9SS type A sorting domain-containing protein [Ekhidna sp.]|uniref:T9SS type A sorting domain-containing protein n=1 Tax=Ekhidna sp. TaxID=2608089 RepID=UPI003CCBF7DA